MKSKVTMTNPHDDGCKNGRDKSVLVLTNEYSLGFKCKCKPL